MLETQYKTEDGIANFQAASVTLDTSVKIYSYRVDSVHTETYKVLGGLSRTDARPESEEGDEAGMCIVCPDACALTHSTEPIADAQDDDDGDGEGAPAGAVEGAAEAAAGVETKGKKERTKKIIVGGVNTLESNLENLNGA